jgi:hypothetical protein
MPPLGEACYQSHHHVVAFLNNSNNSFLSTESVGLNRKPPVTFNDDVVIEETLHVNDFTEEEYRSYWFTTEECNIIIDMIEITVELMEVGQEEDDDTNICYRGLESRTAEGNTYYNTVYEYTVLSVLDEQDNQRHHGLVDEERLALTCRAQTQMCKEFALSRARDDSQEAAKVHILRSHISGESIC